MGKFVCFGEIMARLNPPGYLRLVQTQQLEITYAGGEANVAVSLANFGKNAVFVTRLPDNDLTKAAMRRLRGFGVDISRIAIGGDRMGIYFVEKGASQRASKVLYDRKYSAIAQAQPSDFDWDGIFEETEWFHFTGITPALSDNAAQICLEACKKAKEKGIVVSCDLNYRNKLWTGSKAGTVMGELMEYVDVAIANEEDCEKVFGIKASGTDVTGGMLSKEGYGEVARTLAERFSIPTVAITLRGSISANDNHWAGMLYQKEKCYFSREYLIHIVDRVGGGDSFGAGLIYGCLNEMSAQETIEFAVAASCLKHSIEGDFNQVSVEEVKKLAGGDGSGRVQR